MTFTLIGCSDDEGDSDESSTASGDVYVAGVEISVSGYKARLWKNGVAQNLNLDGSHSYARSVFVVKR